MRALHIIPAVQLQPKDIILGEARGNLPPNLKYRDEVLTKATQLVAGRVSLLIARTTAKRHVRVMYNPATPLLVEREAPLLGPDAWLDALNALEGGDA